MSGSPFVAEVGEAGREGGAAQLVAEQRRDVLEGAVAAVAVQLVAGQGGGVVARALRVAAPVGDEQVEQAIAVVVAPGGGGALAGVAHPGGRGHVAEAGAGLVAQQDVGAVGDDVEVAPAVVVIVGPHGAAGPGVGQGHVGGLLGDAEGAVAVVTVQRARALAAGQEQVEPAVVVVVARRGQRLSPRWPARSEPAGGEPHRERVPPGRVPPVNSSGPGGSFIWTGLGTGLRGGSGRHARS